MRELLKNPIAATKEQFKAIILSTPLFLQCLFAVRHIWWGIGTLFFHFYFSLQQLSFLTNSFIVVGMMASGILGLLGALRDKYYFSLIFSFANIFFLGVIALSFLKFDPRNVNGLNYLIEMFGGIWLVFRIQYDKNRRLMIREALKIGL